MNCQRFDHVVSELARSQIMEADVRAEALAHSEECERCLARLRDEETLTRGLQLLGAEMESLSAPDGLELKLREAFRSRRVVGRIANTSSSRSRYWLVAVAAALLVAASVVAVWWRSDAPQKTVAATAPPPQPAEVRSVPDEPAPKTVEDRADNQTPKRQAPKPVRRNNPPRRAPETAMANHVTNEVATDFVPLGEMNAASLQDGGQIVRVTLRRSALVRFGIPVNMDRYNENVKADVLIGFDGLARAIRFVQ